MPGNSCRSCGAPVRWVRTEAGRRMPINPDPDPAGNLVLDVTGLAVQVDPTATGPKYTSHFATCPEAARHRKPKQRKDTR